MEQRQNEGTGATGDPRKKTHQPVASSGTIPTFESLGVARLGIEPGLPCWKAICSPPTKVSRVRFPAISLPYFRTWESCRTMPLVSEFSRRSPVSPSLHSDAAAYSSHFTLIDSQDLDAGSRGQCTEVALRRTAFDPRRAPHLKIHTWETWWMLLLAVGLLPYPHLSSIPSLPHLNLGTKGLGQEEFREICLQIEIDVSEVVSKHSVGADHLENSYREFTLKIIAFTHRLCSKTQPAGRPQGFVLTTHAKLILIGHREILCITLALRKIRLRNHISGAENYFYEDSYQRPRWVVVRLLASHQGKSGSISGGVAPGFSHVGIMSHYAAGKRVFSGISRLLHPCIPALLHTNLTSPSSALTTSMLRMTPRENPPTNGIVPARFPRAKSGVTGGIEPGSPGLRSAPGPSMLRAAIISPITHQHNCQCHMVNSDERSRWQQSSLVLGHGDRLCAASEIAAPRVHCRVYAELGRRPAIRASGAAVVPAGRNTAIAATMERQITARRRCAARGKHAAPTSRLDTRAYRAVPRPAACSHVLHARCGVRTETLHALRVGAMRRQAFVLVSPVPLPRFLTLDAQLHRALKRLASWLSVALPPPSFSKTRKVKTDGPDRSLCACAGQELVIACYDLGHQFAHLAARKHDAARFYGMDPRYFQDDNARCHVSSATMRWYADNPIEHLWGELDSRVRARQAAAKIR
ncbi:hypothetical protein PR048_008384 [Dryococelus australis]|uniref:Uncharacterized protein n=1 Tax=Dryococelus australis TaxID=614101 RepID=A0ABQ9HX22_9NEOP|nr:hypothetical protein PR048_008384 [Dryococelus australis]